MTIFGLQMMVKSGLEKTILKFHVPFQVCCCPMQKNLPRKVNRLAGISEGARGISKYFFLNHFSPSFLSQKWSFQDLKFLVTYSSCLGGVSCIEKILNVLIFSWAFFSFFSERKQIIIIVQTRPTRLTTSSE
jgi:hypothetical protein